jgi:hypothetical protein
VSGLNKWLHQNGFSYKQPKGVPHKFDEQKQAVFIEEYKTLRDSVSDVEPILFMDAVHILPKRLKCHLDGYVKG